MSVKLFKYVLVISNLILILLPIVGIVSSYFFLWPRFFTDDLDNEIKLQTLAFCIWGLVLILTSICFIGIAFTRSITIHLLAALILCCPLALGVWLVVEQFMFRAQPNWLVSGIAFTASLIWTIQILTELILACALCCSPSPSKDDPEQGDQADKAKGDKGAGDSDSVKKDTEEEGTEEEKEKLVICAQQEQQQQQQLQTAFVPSPQAPPIQEVDEEPDEEDDEEEEPDSQARDPTPQPNHPQELPLHTIPEERQQLLPTQLQGGGGGNVGHCPLATPEDTGV